MVYSVDEVAYDLQHLEINEYDKKYGIRAYLHDWVIEHYKGEALPFEYSIEDAFHDYECHKSDVGFPKDLSPCQLYDEVVTLIIEADAGTPFL